jgi:DNA-binding MarR family transcriptional regulator
MAKHIEHRQETPKSKQEMAEEIVRHLARRHSTAVVLLHHALAELLGVGPTDLQCLDLVRERGTLTGSDLAAITGLTTGAITGIVARLERAGYLRREPDPHDKRKQTLHPSLQRMHEVRKIFEPLHRDVAGLLEEFDSGQLTAITRYLARSRDMAYRHMALMRSQALSATNDLRQIPPATTSPAKRKDDRKTPGGVSPARTPPGS